MIHKLFELDKMNREQLESIANDLNIKGIKKLDNENLAYQILDAEARQAQREAFSKQRTEDYKAGQYTRGGGVVDPLPDDAPYFVKDYYDYYKTERGYHERSGNSTDGWNITSNIPFSNFKFLEYADEIQNAVMVLHGEKAHSLYMGKDAFKKLKGDNKELVIVPGASHTDLYDGGAKDYIPFDKLVEFFEKNLK